MLSERGSLTVEELIALAGNVVLAAMVAYGAQWIIPLAHDVYVSWATSVEIGDLNNETRAMAGPAESIFIPRLDVYGNVQASGIGSPGNPGLVALPNPAPAEVDVAIKENQGVTGTYVFYAYRFNPAAHQLEKIPYYTRRADGTALCAAATPCTTANAVVANSWPANSCSVASLAASQIPSIDPLIAQLSVGKTIPDVALPFGFSSDVLSSNNLYALQCDFTPQFWRATVNATNDYFIQQFQMTAGEPIATTNVTVSYTPPPIGGMSLTVNPNPLTLGYGGAHGLPSSGSVDASVTNYHHAFVVDGVTISAVGNNATCGSIATLTAQTITSNPSGSTDDPPSSFPGTWMAFAVSPTAVGRCTATFATQSGLEAPDNVVQTAPTTIIVEGQLTVSPSALTFSSPSAAAQTVTISEPGYSGSFTVTNGCNGYATPGTPGKGPSTTMSISPIGVTSSPCSITVADSNGTTGSVSVTVDSSPPLTTPSELVLGVGGSSVGTTSGTVAYIGGSRDARIARLLNEFLGGGVALAAGGSPCYAKWVESDGTTPDTSFMKYYPNGFDFNSIGTITVDTNGCEVFSNGAPVPASEAGAVAYNAGGTTVTYQPQQNTCSSIAGFSWGTTNTAPSALYEGSGLATGTCSLVIGNGQSTQTQSADAGLVSVIVSASIAWSSVSNGCSSVDVGNGNVLITCTGKLTATYDGLTTCSAGAGVGDKALSGNGGSAATVVNDASGSSPVSPLPTSASDWSSLLQAAAATAMQNDGGVGYFPTTSGVTITTTGCPLF